MDAASPDGIARSCERALVAAARGTSTRQQIRAAARAFVRRHRGDASYLAWVLRSVATRSALAVALLGLAAEPASAKAPPFAAQTGASNPLNGQDVGNYATPAFGDFDGDGDLDVVAGDSVGQLQFFRNTGTRTNPAFTVVGAIAISPATWAIPAFVDLDADGDLDLVVGDGNGSFHYFENTGNALIFAFVERTGAANPLNGLNVGQDAAPSFGDLDGDGDLDLVAGAYDGQFHYYENTGNARTPAFVLRTGAANPLNGQDVGAVATPSLGDIDGDGDLDLVSGEAQYGTFVYYENTGTRTNPSFVEIIVTASPFYALNAVSLSTTALGDLDGDGDLDLVAGNRYGVFSYFRNLGGTIVARTGTRNPLGGQTVSGWSAPARGDLDGDGDLDLVVSDVNGGFHYFQDTGSSTSPAFVERTGAANPLNGQSAGTNPKPALADLDGDGDLDFVAGESYGRFSYFQNTGTRTSPAFVKRTGAANPLDGLDAGDNATPAFADLDGDGDLDLVSGNQAGGFLYYENTGSAASPAFVPRTGLANPLDGYSIGSFSVPAIGDVDGDGDLDLLAGNSNGYLIYFENTGSPTQPVFVERVFTGNPFGSIDVGSQADPALGDFDADGDLDLISGELGGAFFYFESFLVQQPKAIAITGVANPLNGQDVGSLSAPALADLDRDGDLDVVAGESSGTFLFYENTGTLTAPHYVARTGAANPLNGRDVGDEAKPALADLDGDGDLDLLAGNLAGDLVYFANTGNAKTPAFAAPVTDPFGLGDVGSRSAPVLGDLDGDGDLDLVVGEYFGGFAYFENTGSATSPAFVRRTGAANPFGALDVAYYSTPLLADLDGDGDLDLVTGAEHGRLFWYRNTGTASVPAFEQLGNPANLASIDVGDRSAPAAGDLNGDGTPDLVTGSLAGTFAVHYLPEPARGLLLGAGIALLSLFDRARRRSPR